MGLPYVLSQDLDDDSLVVAAACPFDLVAKPIEDFVIETDGDARFALRHRYNRTTFDLLKSYSRFMMLLILSLFSGLSSSCEVVATVQACD
jgi:hypothetical protein